LRIGNSDVWIVEDKPDSCSIQVPVPPSTNQRQTIGYRKMRGYLAGFQYAESKPVLIKTPEVLDYEQNVLFIRAALRQLKCVPISDYAIFDFYFTLKNPRYDTHNGLKVMCDVLQKAEVVTDDRFILPHVHRPEFSETLPNLIVRFPR